MVQDNVIRLYRISYHTSYSILCSVGPPVITNNPKFMDGNPVPPIKPPIMSGVNALVAGCFPTRFPAPP